MSWGLDRAVNPISAAVSLLSAPRTDPYVPNSGIRLLPRVFDEKALLWPRMKDAWHGQMPLGDDVREPALLAPSQQAQEPAPLHVMAHHPHGRKIGRDREVSVVPPQNGRQPSALLVNRPMPNARQLLANPNERRPPSLALGLAP